MKILAAVGVLAISVIVIALQLSGWSQTEPKTVNLSSDTRSTDEPVSVTSSSSGPNVIGITPGQYSQPVSTSRFLAEVRQQSAFIWPARGPLTSYFGAYHVLGIDIGLDNSQDTPIVAAADGVVEYAGGNACCDYGLYVVLNHEGNRSTLYGHLSQIDVAEGDEVRQGQRLGLGGSTGVSDGKHLHFELRENDGLVDPLRFLPAAERSIQLASLKTDCSTDFLRVDPDSKVFLEFPDAAGFRPVSATFDEDSMAAGFLAGVEGVGGISRRIAVAIPAAPTAKGLIRDANLSVTLSDGPNQRTLECSMRLATMVTMANAPRITRHPGTTSGPPGTPTPTPIRSKYPTPTPPARPATAGNAASTPAKPAATVKPPQQFPIKR